MASDTDGFMQIKTKLALDLIETKMQILRDEIANKLEKWKQTSINDLLTKANSGDLEEAEHDAIVLTNLRYELQELESLVS